MSGGGGNTTTKQVSEPWGPAQPYLLNALGGINNAAQSPPQFYPGQSFAGPNAADQGAWQTRFDYMDDVFGGQGTLQYGNATGAANQIAGGNTALGSLSGFLNPMAITQIGNRLGGPVANIDGLNARPALTRALEGTPDYDAVNAMVTRANEPLLRQFQQQVVPGLVDRGLLSGSQSGSDKALARILPELGERMSSNAINVLDAERNRALTEQMGAARYVGDLGMRYNDQALQLGNLAGTIGAQQTSDQLRAAGLFPTLGQMGEAQGNLAQQYADWTRNFQQQAITDDMNRWNYNQNLPRDAASWYASQVAGLGGLGGTQYTQAPRTSGGAGGALGGGITGAQLGSTFGPIGTAIGGGLGALAGWFL